MAADNTPTIKGGLPLFAFRGIKVLVHWTFIILPAWIAFAGMMEGLGWSMILGRIGLVLIVFVCVVLHEFGHALTAQAFGIGTRDITLLPIGGVASLERMPEEPRQEFWITVAGPSVNLVIAILSFLVILALGLDMTVDDLFLGATTWTKVLLFLFSANVMLFLFNLIPAFPMDGGRILRSLLSMRMPRDRATRIAAGVGRMFAVAFVLFGLMWGHIFLALIGVFIFFAAGAESRMVQQQTALRGVPVRAVMRTRFWAMPHDATVQQAVDELLAGGDHDMLVLEQGRYKGVLTRRDLIQALSDQKQSTTLGQLPMKEVPAVGPESDVNSAYVNLLTGRYPLMPVISQGKLVGVLEPENLAEYMMVRDARTAARENH
jgi:Zn-dependent protease